MHGLGVALHVLGFAVWMGGGMSFMIWGPATRRMPLEPWAHAWLTLAKVQRILVAPACALATVTGLILTMRLAQADFDMGAAKWLMVMQAAGLIAAILTLAFTTPMVNRMAGIAGRSLKAGAIEPAAEKVGKALRLLGGITGLLAIIALYFGAAKPVI